MANWPTAMRLTTIRPLLQLSRVSRLRSWAALPILGLAAALSLATVGERQPPGDTAIARWLQDAPLPAAAELARLAYWLGLLEVTYLLGALLSLIALRRGYWPEALLIAAALGARSLNPFLRSIVDSPRPGAEEIRVTVVANGHGFPSSHTIGAVLLFGAIAYLAGRVPAGRRSRLGIQALAIAAILVTGFGRVYTGAHWPSDVLGAYLWGTGLLIILISCYRRWLRRADTGRPRLPGFARLGTPLIRRGRGLRRGAHLPAGQAESRAELLGCLLPVTDASKQRSRPRPGTRWR